MQSVVLTKLAKLAIMLVALVATIAGTIGIYKSAQKKNKPYIVRDDGNPDLASVYIYRLARGGSSYSEYKFMRRDGKWKVVIEKGDIIFAAICMAVFSLLMLIATGSIWGILMSFVLFSVGEAVFAVHYFEAYVLLMKDKNYQK